MTRAKRSLLGAVLVLGAAADPVAARAEGSGGGETVVIRADRVRGPVVHRLGLLHGITYETPGAYATAIERLTELKPGFWRLANHRNDVYGFVAGEARFPEKLKTKMTFVLQDAFNVRYGTPIEVRADCPSGRRGCFPSFEMLRERWSEAVEQFMRAAPARYPRIDYIDVFAEPNWGWKGVTRPQLLELFKLAHDIVRRHDPDAKIVAPSLGEYDRAGLATFLRYIVDNDLRLDALSWHEFQAPEAVPRHVREMREIFEGNPSLCRPDCPEIHINEYSGPKVHLIPGWEVAWLEAFDRAGVDQIHRACWDVPGRWSTCWNGFNGLFLKDNATPQALYWVHKEYSRMSGRGLAVEVLPGRMAALAARDDAARELRIILGRYGGGGGAATGGRLVVEGYPYPGPLARVQVARVPGSRGRPVGLPRPFSHPEQFVPVEKGRIALSLSDFADGDAVFVVLSPAVSGER